MIRLRRETRSFKAHAINSLILAIELFNRPHSTLRSEAVLFFLQYSFEMLLKALIFQSRGRISDRGSPITYRFDKCVGIARSELGILSEDEANSLSILDGFRDCAMHNLLDISEGCLYLQAQAAVTIFNYILERKFEENLSSYLPERILPISTNPPEEIQLFMDQEFSYISSLIMPGKRRGAEARARIRSYLIMESVLEGINTQPTERQTKQALLRIRKKENWKSVFPGVSTLRLDTSGRGLTHSVIITREKTATPVYIVHEGEEVNNAAIVREVNLIDRYSMGLFNLADKLGLGRNKTLALIRHLNLQNNSEYFKEFKHGAMHYKGYTPKALEFLKETKDSLSDRGIDKIWQASSLRRRISKQKEE